MYNVLFCICNILILLTNGHRIQKRIAYGKEAEPHSRPYQVHIVIMLQNGDVNTCGGALISKKYVLTAAHCFMNKDDIIQTIVALGAHNLNDTEKKYQITKKYILHDMFDHIAEKGYTKNDIALVKLDTPIELSENIKLIDLPKFSQANSSFNNATVIEAGWGKTEFQDTSDILVQGVSKVTEDEPICTYPETLLCTLSKDGHAPCKGDSGSPLVLDGTIIGILSTGFCVAFSYYTRVTSFLDWIQEHSDVKILN